MDGNATFGGLLERGAAWSLLGCGAWGLLVAGAVLLEAASGGRLCAPWLCPPATRRVLVAAVGLALAGAVPAGAAPRPGPWPGPWPGPRSPAGTAALGIGAPLDGLPVPARPAGPADPGGALERHVTVRPGDSLWAIAERTLPAGAGDVAVVRRVARLHALNRERIGPDPDLVVPGQRLVLPPASKETDR